MDNYTLSTIDYAASLVRCYRKYDAINRCYTISMNNLAEHDKYRLVALMMQDDEMQAAEATGPDNPMFTDHMLPVLIRYLKSDRLSTASDFADVWRDACLKYYSDDAEKLLQYSIMDYNESCETPDETEDA